MDYTIYSIGETEFLFSVLNGIVRIFDTTVSGFASYIAIASLLMLLGGLLAKIFNDKTTPIKDWIFGLIFFFILAGPMSKVDVELIGVRDGSVYTVDNVPLFAALGGYLATSLSHLLANDFKQSFQLVNPTTGDLDPLRALQQVQNIGLSQNQIVGVDENYDPIGSIQNYIKNCFVAEYLINKDSGFKQSKLKNNPLSQGWDAIKVNTNTLEAYVFLGAGGEWMGCRDAHALIDSMFFESSTGFKKVMDDYFLYSGINQDTFIESFNNILVANDPGSTAASSYDAASGIFLNNQLLIASSNGDSVAGYYDSVDRERFTARHNRLYTMASERGMWMEMSVGMVTILESFVFFIAPIMAIMLVMGGMGLKALVTYFGLTVWVNFWPITMTFVNLYTEMAIAGKFAGLNGAAGSFGMFDESMTTIESSIAFASQLTAMIPMLTLFVLYRGVHTMMGVASQTSPNSFNGQSAGQGSLVKGEAGNYTSGNTQHQLAGAGSGNSQSSFSTSSGNMHGLRTLGASFSTSGGSSTDLANASSEVSSKKAAHGEAFQNLSNQAVAHSNQNMSGEEIAASSSKSAGVAAKVASSFKDGDAVKQQEVFKALMAIDAKVAGGLTSGVKIDSGSGSASINASAGMSVSDVISQSKESGLQLTEDEETSMAQSLTKQISAAQNWKNTDTDTEQNSISTAYSNLQKRESAYEEATRQQSQTAAKFANQSVANITSELEQGASSVRLSSDKYTQEQVDNKDTESSYIKNAVDGMEDNEVLAWSKGLGFNTENVSSAQENVNKTLQGYQDDELAKVVRDTNYSGRSDHEGIAVHQAILKGFKEVSENVEYDPNNVKTGDISEVSTARINESANELRGLGQIYQSMGKDDRVNSANLSTVGDSLVKSANSVSQAVEQEQAQNITNSTDVESGHKGKLLDKFDGENGETKSFSAQTMGNYLKGTEQSLNAKDQLTSKDPTKEVNKETKGADNLYSDVQGKISDEQVKMKENMESLKTSAMKLGAIQNQVGGMKDGMLDLTADAMDIFGGTAGPEEKLAAMAAYTDAPLASSMVRGFDLLSDKNDLEVKDILKNGLNPDSDQYHENKGDALDISVASSSEGQQVYNETLDFWGSQTLSNTMTQDEKAKYGDGVDTDKWAQISTNMNKLNDNDINNDGKISDNERGLTHQLANNPETKMATLSHHAVVKMAGEDGAIPESYEWSKPSTIKANSAPEQLANVMKNDAYIGHINEMAGSFDTELPTQARPPTVLSDNAKGVGLNEIYADTYNGDAHYNHNMEAALTQDGVPSRTIRSMDREHATETIQSMDKAATRIENFGYPDQADSVRDRATVLQQEHNVTSDERFGKDVNKEDAPKRR